MKFTLHKKTKKYILAVLILLFFFISYQTYKAIGDEEIVIEETTVFEYNCQPNVDYKVSLHPNELFSDTIQEEGNYYSKPLLDNIQADFNVAYQSSEITPIKVEYEMSSKINGYQGQAANKIIYWSKDFPMMEKKVVSTEGDSWEVKEQVNFDLQKFDDFAVKAKEIYGMKVSNELIVELFGSITAVKDDEEIVVPFSSNIQLPLLEDVFRIEKFFDEPLHAAVTEVNETIVPYNKTKVSLLIVTLLLVLASMPILVFGIKEPDELTILRKKNNGLLKNYGSRMVAMQEIPDLKYNQYFQVYSIKDMIKISDEVQKPIIYIPDESIMLRNNELFIIDENNLYRWNSA